MKAPTRIKATNMIRVFPRKTQFSPIDDLAFYDEPPLYPVPDLPIVVSVVFTWDIERGKQLALAWNTKDIGGPAFGNPGGEFEPGRFIKRGVTITSRGCPKNCPWCFVPKREGKLRELKIKSGHIVNDNNLLACSQGHIEKVFEMLANQKKGIEFKGGIDIDYLEPWHVEMMKKIKVAEIWVACDSKAGLNRLDKAVDLLADFSINKKRCYVLIGHGDETITEAESRCKAVYAKGFLPFAQLFRDETDKNYSKEWRNLARKWSRPAIYRSTTSTTGAGRDEKGKE